MGSRPAQRSALLAVLCLLSCGSDDPLRADAAVHNDLVFTRAGGDPLEFAPESNLFVWCGPWDGDAVPVPSLRIVFAGPTAGQPFWMLKAVLADVRPGVELPFPNVFIWNQPRDVEMFVLDPPNELSTATAASSGSITFQQLDCDAGQFVEFSIDAQIGSEVGGQPITVRGTFRAPIEPAPPGTASEPRRPAP